MLICVVVYVFAEVNSWYRVSVLAFNGHGESEPMVKDVKTGAADGKVKVTDKC